MTRRLGTWVLLFLVSPAIAGTNTFPLSVERIDMIPFAFKPQPRPESLPSLRPSPFTNVEQRVGEVIGGFRVKEVIPRWEIGTNRLGKVEKNDRTEIVLERNGREFRIIRGREQYFTELKVDLVDGTNSQRRTLGVGVPFEFRGRPYKIEKVDADARTCTVRDLSTGELLATRPPRAPGISP